MTGDNINHPDEDATPTDLFLWEHDCAPAEFANRVILATVSPGAARDHALAIIITLIEMDETFTEAAKILERDFIYDEVERAVGRVIKPRAAKQ